MTLTIIAIILALFLGSAIMVAVRHYYRSDSLLRKNNAQQIQIDAYQDANNDPKAFYSVQRVETDNPEYREYNGHWAICRRIAKRGYLITTTIKVFTDDDDDFNFREASDLLDKLKEK
ncbi:MULTISPECIES: hypothetical protein [Muribaculaceae]|uniref:hypothetical protein n=1 Tax=Muribaculaceae TaxID=2005473 RepID=UPI002649B8F4|nr:MULTISPECIES: hypothetical protein [Muribaculaceae]